MRFTLWLSLGILSCLTSVTAWSDSGSILTIDVSGRDGQNGKDGTSYGSSQAGGTAATGANGGSATTSTPGQSAGQVQLNLSSLTLNAEKTPQLAPGVMVIQAKLG